MRCNPLSVSALVLALGLGAGAAQAQALRFAKTEDAIKYRQNALFVMSQHFGSLGAMANGRAPFDAALAQRNGEALELLVALPWQGFAAGHEGGRAKPEVWKEKAQFDAYAQRLVDEGRQLAASAKTGDLAQIKASFGAAAQTCKSCHDAFRNR